MRAYCVLVYLIILSGCGASNIPITERLEVLPEQKHVLIHEAIAFSCQGGADTSKSDYWSNIYKNTGEGICLYFSRGAEYNKAHYYGERQLQTIPVGTEVKLIRFYSHHNLIRSSDVLIVQLPTVFGDKEIIMYSAHINHFLGLEYPYARQMPTTEFEKSHPELPELR